jgi:uncharacterized protein with von Willebrand factor type A (vWA) domain
LADPDATVDPIVTMTGFARVLRANGVAADGARLATAIEALTYVDPLDAQQVYWAGRVALCGEPDDLPRYDVIFDAWFRGRFPLPPDRRTTRSATQRAQLRSLAGHDHGPVPADAAEDPLPTAASDAELLRHRDVRELTDLERDEINAMISLLTPRVPRRPTRRRRPNGRDAVDVSRTVRALLRDGGELAAIARLRPRVKPRRLVLLIDVSGSMSPYADALLRFAHAAVRAAPTNAEAFTMGTRLTRVTRQLRIRDPRQALAAAGLAIPDWSGGTRLGEALQAFLDLWGQRGTARRAVVVIASDGWERGDAALLGEQMARLARLAHRVVWVNPHRGKAGFAPVTGGMIAALPFVDELLAGHTLDALHTLAEVMSRA